MIDIDNRHDATCIHCGAGGFEPVDEKRDGEEYHITSRCDVCGKETVFLYNLKHYNSVTPDEYAAGDVEAGL